MATKVCRKCGEEKVVSEVTAESQFPRNKQYEDGYDKSCKACWKSGKKTGGFGGSKKKTKFTETTPRKIYNFTTTKIDHLHLLPVHIKMVECNGDLDVHVESFEKNHGYVPVEIYQYKARYFLVTKDHTQLEN
jgi:hypothetical protein